MAHLLKASIFYALGLILLGGSVAMFFEGAELEFGGQTISSITNSAAVGHPAYTAIACFVAGGVIFGLLVHFVGWKP